MLGGTHFIAKNGMAILDPSVDGIFLLTVFLETKIQFNVVPFPVFNFGSASF